MAAWKDACSDAGSSVFLVPEGTFLVGAVSFSGPCHSNKSPKIEIGGTLKAPISLKAFPSSDWIVFTRLNGINLTGINSMAVLDGQGAQSWSEATCRQLMNCPNFPIVSSKTSFIYSLCKKNQLCQCSTYWFLCLCFVPY